MFDKPIREEFNIRKHAIIGHVNQIVDVSQITFSSEALVSEIVTPYFFEAHHIVETEQPYLRELPVDDLRYIVEYEIHGSTDALNYQPTNYTCDINGRDACSLQDDRLVFVYEKRYTTAEMLPNFLERDKKIFLDNNECLLKDIERFNEQLIVSCRAALEERKVKLNKHQADIEKIGIPIRRVSNAPQTYKVPEIKRKIPRFLSVGKKGNMDPEPLLPISEYEHILEIVSLMTSVMERSPSAFKETNEEGIRMHFLVQLNAQYEWIGDANAEVFNYKGKTDIFIRNRERSVFIAECAIWRGRRYFLDKIAQLQEYLTWKDTKAALFIFNRNVSFSSVLSNIESTIPDIPNYIESIHYEKEEGFRFTLRRNDDSKKSILITVLVFNIPA